ncbi:MAG TPA: riboflavin biosynthesis protein RibF [Candidatus Latescibacteria bacterium]|nr:riboflavin biosynthesis protein RibF [Candidatus Latescibacterota bacterium]HQK22273.1 riboflavin biosynthesis protein RibF [Candidatus Latescibacterota bacterium]
MASTAITVGSYDGVHSGHRAMIAQLCASARERDLQSILVTFEPHHRIYFHRETKPFLLTTTSEKRVLLQETCLDGVIVLPFSAELAALSARDFIKGILVERLGARLLLVGHDQAFGKDQCTGRDAITACAAPLGVEVLSPAPVSSDGRVVSSTRIRGLIRTGSIAPANHLLGAPYLVSGRVVHGRERGRSLGYPTANLSIEDPFKLIPGEGIYAVFASCGGSKFAGMGYIGTRSTFGETDPVVEIALLDTNVDLYGQELQVRFVERVRADHRFPNADALLAQIRRDEQAIRSILAAHRDSVA